MLKPVNALYFDGASQVDCGAPAAINALTELTVEILIYPQLIVGDNRYMIVLCDDAQFANFSWRLGIVDGGKLNWGGSNGAAYCFNLLSGAVTIGIDDWYHLVATHSLIGGFARSYIADALDQEDLTLTGSMQVGQGFKLMFGARNRTVDDDYYVGKIAEIRIFGRAFGLDEVGFNNRHPNVMYSTTDLIGWWKFYKGAGATLFDLAGTANGTIVGAAWQRLAYWDFFTWA